MSRRSGYESDSSDSSYKYSMSYILDHNEILNRSFENAMENETYDSATEEARRRTREEEDLIIEATRVSDNAGARQIPRGDREQNTGRWRTSSITRRPNMPDSTPNHPQQAPGNTYNRGFSSTSTSAKRTTNETLRKTLQMQVETSHYAPNDPKGSSHLTRRVEIETGHYNREETPRRPRFTPSLQITRYNEASRGRQRDRGSPVAGTSSNTASRDRFFPNTNNSLSTPSTTN